MFSHTTELCDAAMALCVTEVDKDGQSTIQYGNMYRLNTTLYEQQFELAEFMTITDHAGILVYNIVRNGTTKIKIIKL